MIGVIAMTEHGRRAILALTVTLAGALVPAAAADGCAVVAVLHDLNLALGYADRVVLLDDGKVAAEGSPDATLTRANIAAVFGVNVRRVAVVGGGEVLAFEG
jgi:ABC-type hemin transport system ATPase subunit